MQILKFYYKLTNDKLPAYFNNLPLFPCSLLHNYNAKGRDNIYITQTSHLYAKQCIRHQLGLILNDTPGIIKDQVNTRSIQGFSAYIKKYYLDRYETNCYIQNCYVCNIDN